MSRDGTPFTRWDQAAAAAAFLTRLPLPPRAFYPDGALARAVWSFPLVGAVIGTAAALVILLCLHFHFPRDAAILVGLGAAMLLTGALHEDGLADTADGFGGGSTAERKLDIMKDSRIGSYGVLALIVAVGLKVMALSQGGVPVVATLIGAHAISRAVMPCLMRFLPTARPGGLGASAGQPSTICLYAALAIGWLIGCIALGVGQGSLALLAALITTTGIGWLARRQIGGYTGDVLGAAQQIAEVAVILIASTH